MNQSIQKAFESTIRNITVVLFFFIELICADVRRHHERIHISQWTQ